jgi:nucleoside-diphosphate-sugar epimerase
VILIPRAIITGGAGFIGSHLVELLLSKNFEVKVIDDLSNSSIENIKPFLKEIDFVKTSILNKKKLFKEFNGFDYCFHLAALKSVIESVENPLKYSKVNIEGTINVLSAAIENSLKKIVFSSSCSVYGSPKTLPSKESTNLKPESPYALTKIVGEHFMKLFNELYSIETVSLRFFNVFGPKQDPNSSYANVIPLFVKAALSEKNPTIFGSGKQSRDFIFVKDVVKASFLALKSKKSSGKIYNIGSGKPTTILELFKKIKKFTGKKIKPVFKPKRKGEAMHIYADISLAKKELKFKPSYSFDEGLKKTINYYKNQFLN